MKNKRKNILITKASGEVLPFSESRLISSLQRAGASTEIAESIVDALQPRLYRGVTTKKIYRWAFNLLKERSKHLAAKYHLKRGIMELGPSGYPFEKFIGEILKYQGYSVAVGQVIKGQCVSHEVDVIAEKENNHFMIECKYHNQPGTVCDVKIPLYIQSRFKDIETVWNKLQGHETKFHQGWVFTNTHFTSDAIKYGNCAGLKLIGWDYPNKGSLRDQIDTLKLYPITCLTSLTKSEKQLLLEQKIVLCKEICDDIKVLDSFRISPSRLNAIREESLRLCGHVMPDENTKS